MKTIKELGLKKTEDLAKLDSKKLSEEIKGAEKLFYTLRMKLNLGEQKQTHLLKVMRRYIASMKTLLTKAK